MAYITKQIVSDTVEHLPTSPIWNLLAMSLMQSIDPQKEALIVSNGESLRVKLNTPRSESGPVKINELTSIKNGVVNFQ